MRRAPKHLMIFCSLLAMLWAQVFGMQHHLFVCLCSNEPVETAVDHCHDPCEEHQKALTADHHQDHDCDQKEGNAQHHSRLKEDLKARSQTSTAIAPHTPVFVMLFPLPELLVPKLLLSITGSCGSPVGEPSLTPSLSLRVHQSVVFLI